MTHPSSQPAPQRTALWLLLSSILLAGLLIGFYTLNEHQQLIRNTQHQNQNSVITGARALEQQLFRWQNRLELIAKAHEHELINLINQPDNSWLKGNTEKKFRSYFPELITFALSDNQGHFLTHDINEHMGDLCLQEIPNVSHQQNTLNGKRISSIHPGPTHHHVDLILPYLLEDREIYLFISIHPIAISDLLAQNQRPNSQLLLISQPHPNLIEVSAQGSRNQLQRDFYLNAAETERIRQLGYQSAVTGTEWNLVALPDDKSYLNQRHSLWFQGMSFLLIFGLFAYLIYRYYLRQLQQQQQQQQTLEQLNQALENRIAQRTASLQQEIERRTETEKALIDSERRWQFALESTGHGVWDWNLRNDHIFFSSHWLALLGLDKTHTLCHPSECTELIHPDDRQTYQQQITPCLAGQQNHFACDIRMRCADGQYRWMHDQGMIIEHDQDNRPLRLIGTMRDIQNKKEQELRLKLAASVFGHASEGIVITDAQHNIIEVNDAFIRMSGYNREDIIGYNRLNLFKPVNQNSPNLTELNNCLNQQGLWHEETRIITRNGQLLNIALSVSPIYSQDHISHTLAIYNNITPLKDTQKKLEQLAYFDPLTGVPNRFLLMDRLHQAMASCQRNRCLLAICYLDLDGFKPINDTLGHEQGDVVLKTMAERLQSTLRSGDTIARLGGDEFVLLLTGFSQIEEYTPVLQRLLKNIQQPCKLLGKQAHLSASIGVSIYPLDGQDADTLLRHADQAMYQVKSEGRNGFRFFNSHQDNTLQARFQQRQAIAQGIEDNQFRLYYQPQVNLRLGRVTGMEALIRWQHPQQGLLYPADFLPLIEHSELMIDLDQWVIRQAISHLNQWQQQGFTLKMSVNLSADTLQQPSFPLWLQQQLAAYPNPRQLADSLMLELVESAAIKDIACVTDIMQQCQAMGVNFALDDFGTGYSSLTYFRQLPASLLKIDQSFVRDMLEDSDDLTIVEGVITLAKAFQRQVIAEGVETTEHCAILLHLGCEQVQGYAIAKPMPVEQIEPWCKSFTIDQLLHESQASHNLSLDDIPLLTLEADHRIWIENIAKVLRGDTRTLSFPLEETACRFGRWYYDHGQKRYAHLASFASLESLHSEVHRLAQELIKLHASDPQQALARLPELYDIRNRLISQLQQLQVEAIRQQLDQL